MSVVSLSKAIRSNDTVPPAYGQTRPPSERWLAIERLFEACLDATPTEREVLLGDAEATLRQEVQSLLAHVDGDARPLQQAVGRASLASLASQQAGQLVGPWRLLRALGEGGMGQVWLAERADGQFAQQVALKFVALGGDLRGWDQRFMAERQILARLQHPNIARLLDGGSDERGLPWLAMEYVDGLSLHEWCDGHSLAIEQRVQLLQQICAAVDHAHRHLVVHRDLKPANILVSDTGPMLLDFGIARMLQASGAQAEAMTATGERLLTPAYASPEQLLGEAASTSSDVYALGLLLYELLSGWRARGREGDSIAAHYRASQQTLVRPSQRVLAAVSSDELLGGDDSVPGTGERLARQRGLTARSLARRLAGDLDTITLKATHSDPARRYRSAADLADDLQRYLDGRPVHARPDAWHYRFGKLCRRQPWAVATVAMLLALCAVFVVGLLQQADRLARERDRAIAAESQAQAVSGFLVDLFEVADPMQAKGSEVSARELVERGSQRVATQLAEQPLVQATLLMTLADVTGNLGMFEQGAELHEQAFRLRERLLGPEHRETLASRDRLGDSLRSLSRFDEAESLLRLNLELRRKHADVTAGELADSLNNLGLLLSTRQQTAQAEALLREAVALRQQALGPDHALTLVSLNNLALEIQDRQPDEAEQLFTTVYQQRKAALGEHPLMANSAQNLGTLYLRKGDIERAEPLLRESLDVRRSQLPVGHPYIAASLNELAFLYHDQLRVAEAEAHYREMLAIDRQIRTGPTLQTAHGLNNLASLLQERARYSEAHALYEESIILRSQLLGADSDSAQRVRLNLAQSRLHAGDPDSAALLLEQVAAQLPANPADNPKLWMDLLRRRAEWLSQQGAPDQAMAALEQGLQLIRDHALGQARELELSVELARAQALLGDSRCQTTLAGHAGALAGERLPLRRARTLWAQGLCAQASGDPIGAQRALQAGVALLSPALPDDNYWLRSLRASLRSS